MNSSDKNVTAIPVGHIVRSVKRAVLPAELPFPGAQSDPGAPGGNAKEGPAPSGPGPAEIARMAEESYRQGRQDGKRDATRELAAAVQLFRASLKEFERERQEMYKHCDRQIAVLAVAAAQKVLDRELEDQESLKALLLRALSQAPGHCAARIRMNPEDLRLIEQSRSELQKAGAPLPEEMVLLSDPGISRGGCIIESTAGNIDARVGTQLKLIEEALSAPAAGDSHAASS